jgi:NADPH:quinone reductase-like Zn-dependent oxidoreductase
VDVKLRAKSCPQGHPRVLDFDGSGVVVAVGEAVALFAPGDRVFHAGHHRRTGTNSQYHLVDERIAGRMPASLSFEEAAALPLSAWELLFDRLGVPAAKARSGAYPRADARRCLYADAWRRLAEPPGDL